MAVFGIDNRQIVTNTTSPPWSSVVHLEFGYSGTTTRYIATGFLVGPNDVLTAAHIPYDPTLGGYATWITATPAASGDAAPFGTYTVTAVQVAPGFVENFWAGIPAAAPHDFAILTLDRNTTAPVMPFGTVGQGAILGKTTTSAGYPVGKGGDVMFHTSGTVDGTSDHALIYNDDLDLSSGQSGAPILYQGAAVGLLSHDYGGPNSALRFDADRVGQIDFWRTTNDPSAGPDFLYGGPWGERWDAGAGNDTVAAMDGNDTVFGGAGNDDVNGNKGTDLVYGGPGSDFVRGGQGNDLVYGEDGDDWHVNGNLGEDVIFGGNGNDQVFGGGGNDLLYGEDGDDTLSGDLGNDMLVGGFGRDVFLFLEGAGDDRILDFNPAHDMIQGPQAISITAADGSSLVQLAGGGTILLHGVAPSALDAEHFLVV